MPAGSLKLVTTASSQNRNRRHPSRMGGGRYFRKYKIRKPFGQSAMARSQGKGSVYKWFKLVETVPANIDGKIYATWRPRDVSAGNNQLTDVFFKYASFFSTYQVVKIVVKLFPTGLGSESLQDAQGRPMHKRGDVVTWINQSDLVQGPPTSINEIISRGSARIRQARNRIKMWTTRPFKEFPIWGDIGGDFDNPAITFVDPYNSTLAIYGDNFTPSNVVGNQVFYWAFAHYKVQFKGMTH